MNGYLTYILRQPTNQPTNHPSMQQSVSQSVESTRLPTATHRIRPKRCCYAGHRPTDRPPHTPTRDVLGVRSAIFHWKRGAVTGARSIGKNLPTEQRALWMIRTVRRAREKTAHTQSYYDSTHHDERNERTNERTAATNCCQRQDAERVCRQL